MDFLPPIASAKGKGRKCFRVQVENLDLRVWKSTFPVRLKFPVEFRMLLLAPPPEAAAAGAARCLVLFSRVVARPGAANGPSTALV